MISAATAMAVPALHPARRTITVSGYLRSTARFAPQPATGPGVEQAMEGHILASAEVMGTFGR